MMNNINAVDLLKKLTQQRNWHQGKIDAKAAAMLKTNLNRGKVSYEKACETLQLLGFTKIQEEVWQPILS
jgi:hypothetical protein